MIQILRNLLKMGITSPVDSSSGGVNVNLVGQSAKIYDTLVGIEGQMKIMVWHLEQITEAKVTLKDIEGEE